MCHENDSDLRYSEVSLKGKNKTLVKILGGQHRTTTAGQILGVATPATPAALTPMVPETFFTNSSSLHALPSSASFCARKFSSESHVEHVEFATKHAVSRLFLFTV